MIAAFVVTIAAALIGIATGSQFILLLGSLAGYAVFGLFALAWLRLLLQGSKGAAADAAKFEVGPRDQKFFAYYGLLLVPVFLLMLIGMLLQNSGFAGTFVGLILALGVVALYTAIQFVFPVTALGDSAKLDSTWKQIQPDYGPMFGVNAILAIVIAIPLLIVSYILGLIIVDLAVSAGMGGLIVGVVIADAIMTPIYLVAIAVMVTGLALVYRRVTGGPAIA